MTAGYALGVFAVIIAIGLPGVLVALSTLLVEETSALALCGLGLLLLCHRQVRLGLLLAGVAAAWLAVVTLALDRAHRIELKIVHVRLQEVEGVETSSAGAEPNRYVVVSPI